MRRSILMTTWGSLGDLHPYLAVALGLRQRGHAVTIATSEVYRGKIEGEGIGFAPVRPNLGELLQDRNVLRRALDLKTGTEYVIRSLVMPFVEQAYQDLLAATQGADLLVSHPLAYALPLIAETLRVPWISVVLSPIGLFSAIDPPVFGPAPYLRGLRRLGRWPYALTYSIFKAVSRSWAGPVDRLRLKLGLPKARQHPLVEGAFSPYGTLAWFSKLFAAPQPDWPPRTVVTGFPFFDYFEPSRENDPSLDIFLSKGEPPVVFTLGSAAVWEAGDFYEQSLAAALRLGRRAVLVIGAEPRNRPRGALPESVCVVEYARYSRLFSHGAVTVHQGGIGTTAQALRAGKPMLVVPFSHDQPDNAARAERLGVSKTLDRRKYDADSATRELRRLLNDPGYAARATDLGRRMQAEDGVACACDAIERVAAARRSVRQ